MGVVLAGGAGERFARSGGEVPKPLVTVGGLAMVDRVLTAVLEAGLDEVVLVDGCTDLTDRSEAGVTVLHNARWAEGIASSLQVAIAHARVAGHDAVVVGLADQPGVPADAWRAVAGARADVGIAVATYDGQRGNPVRLASWVWDLLPSSGDEGARSLMRGRPDLVGEVPCNGEPWDVDTVEDLEQWS